MKAVAESPQFAIETTAAESARLRLCGDWCIGAPVPPFSAIAEALHQAAPRRLTVDSSALHHWDSQLMTRLLQCQRWCEQHDVELDTESLPEGIRHLLQVATAVAPAQAPAARSGKVRLQAFLRAIWRMTVDEVITFLDFIGQLAIAVWRMLRRRANVRGRDFFYFVEQAGPDALGIVTLIAVLVGMILAYLGSVQLQAFGAQVYVADLVALGMVREMGALMTAVIMAGRTGAAYAAQLGTMQTNDEIDAISILGISPIEFLVLPRMLALVAMMPLLTLYANVLGVVGGGLVATGMGVSFTQFIYQTQEAIDFTDINTGLIKSVAFGLLIAIAGCQAGMRCGRSSAAVGEATTSAVVHAIVYLIMADALFNIIYYKLGI